MSISIACIIIMNINYTVRIDYKYYVNAYAGVNRRGFDSICPSPHCSNSIRIKKKKTKSAADMPVCPPFVRYLMLECAMSTTVIVFFFFIYIYSNRISAGRWSVCWMHVVYWQYCASFWWKMALCAFFVWTRNVSNTAYGNSNIHELPICMSACSST